MAMRAVVDIGSNSVKVLVAKMQQKLNEEIVIEEIFIDAVTSSLARGLPQTGRLSPGPIAETLQALRKFQSEIKQYPVEKLYILGTAALREASNPEDLCCEVERIFKMPVEIISGLKEAEISLKGALTARPDGVGEEDCTFCDLGGASTELGFLKPFKNLVSTSLGALKTHNALCLGGGAVSDDAWKGARAYIQSTLLKEVSSDFKKTVADKGHFIAVGGTIVMATQSLGLKAFKASCYRFKTQDLDNFADQLRKIDESERSKIPHLKKDRADILPFGILVLTEIMKFFGFEEGISTVRGLRHGMVMMSYEE